MLDAWTLKVASALNESMSYLQEDLWGEKRFAVLFAGSIVEWKKKVSSYYLHEVLTLEIRIQRNGMKQTNAILDISSCAL